jgi:pyrroline-5-carboxylate reductase
MDLIIIGAGAMGMALAKGLENNHNIEFVVRDISKYKELESRYRFSLLENYTIDNKSLILAVKPHALVELKDKLKGKAKTIYSVLAGVTIDSIKDIIVSEYYIRAMPNISAKFQKSTTVITGDIQKRDEALELFSLIGDVFWTDSEKEIDISTAVAGSGPALLALVAEALADGLVKEGLKRELASNITSSLFNGFAPLIDNMHPSLIKDSVMSPAGTTARAYYALEKSAVRGAFISAVEEAYRILRK